MGLGDLFRSKKVPQKQGKKTKKVYFFEFPSVPGQPLFELIGNHQLGSHEGVDFLIQAPDISGKHLSIKFENDLVSIIDLNSIKGTFLNNIQIASGKEYFINPQDKIRLGNIPVHLNFREEEDASEVEELPPPVPQVKTKVEITAKDIPIKKKKSQFIALGHSEGKTTTSLPRLIALLSDFFLTYGVINLFYGFEEFSLMLKAWKDLIGSLINPVILKVENEIIHVNQQSDAIKMIFQELHQFFEQHPMWLETIGFFIFIRVFTAFIFGVSISQFLMGLRGSSLNVWRHFGGLLREVIGFILAPFFIFDMPTLLGFRSLKEILTYTRINTINPWWTSFLSPLVFIIFLGFFIFSPLYKNFEVAPVIKMNKTQEQLITAEKVYYSDYFQFAMNKDDQFIYIPKFSFKMKDGELIFSPEILFYDKTEKKEIQLKQVSTFQMSDVFLSFFEGNPLAEKKFPTLSTLTFNTQDISSSFKVQIKEIEQKQLVAEFSELFDMMNQFELFKMDQFILKNGPFLKGYRDFIDKFYALIGKNHEFSFMNYNSYSILQFKGLEQQTFVIPIDIQGRKYELSAKNKDFAEKTNKKLLNNIQFIIKEKPILELVENKESIDILEFIDSLALSNISENKRQYYFSKFYTFYFQLAQQTIRENNDQLNILFMNELKSFIELINELIKYRTYKQLAVETLQTTLAQLNELLLAYNNQDRVYLQVEVEI